ncbi:hypothetical protein PIB30_070439 [Stylosanthes scabra]|uniref:Uncharacterized protein n=1 Tax=Stylosanthes scabra TaxID=79078 RepID=A0ABU6VQB3_9FABA|nr:hypothetical protein [Stylosanthes scabra]
MSCRPKANPATECYPANGSMERTAIAGDGIHTICLEYQGYRYTTSSSQRNLVVLHVLANGTWYATCSSHRNMAALDEPKTTTFNSGEPYFSLILSNRRVREVNRRMSSWPAFRTRHGSYLFAHLIVCVYLLCSASLSALLSAVTICSTLCLAATCYSTYVT